MPASANMLLAWFEGMAKDRVQPARRWTSAMT